MVSCLHLRWESVNSRKQRTAAPFNPSNTAVVVLPAVGSAATKPEVGEEVGGAGERSEPGMGVRRRCRCRVGSVSTRVQWCGEGGEGGGGKQRKMVVMEESNAVLVL